MKSEPSVFSFQDLVKAPKKTASWEGVRNYQARNFMRDAFQVGDAVLFYHSSCDVPAAVGVATVVKEGYPDKFAMDPKHKYCDPDAIKKGENPWLMVDVQATHLFEVPVTRELLKSAPALKEMMVLKKGSRLSIQPVTEREFEAVLKLGHPKKV